MSVHAHPETQGRSFGRVVVTVDVQAGDCVVRAPQPSKGPASTVVRKARFTSIEAIEAAWATQNALAKKPALYPHAAHIAEALKYAADLLTQRGKGNHYG